MSVVSLHIECTDSIESILIMTYNMNFIKENEGGGGEQTYQLSLAFSTRKGKEKKRTSKKKIQPSNNPSLHDRSDTEV